MYQKVGYVVTENYVPYVGRKVVFAWKKVFKFNLKWF
jgi:hypothetical protein